MMTSWAALSMHSTTLASRRYTRLMATEACARLGLASSSVHLDTTSFHVDGRYNSAEPPEETVIHITQGYSRDRLRPCRMRTIFRAAFP